MIGVLLLLESDSVVEQVALLVEGKLVAEKVDCSQCMSIRIAKQFWLCFHGQQQRTVDPRHVHLWCLCNCNVALHLANWRCFLASSVMQQARWREISSYSLSLRSTIFLASSSWHATECNGRQIWCVTRLDIPIQEANYSGPSII